MPRVKWGGADLADAIESAEEGYEEYTGPKPERGVYRFRITRLYKSESSGGFPQMEIFLEMDPPADRKEHMRYKDFFMRNWIIVKDDGSTGFKVKPFLAAVGVTPKQFATGTIIGDAEEDNNGNERFPITKIGNVKFPGTHVWGYIKPSKRDPEYYDISYKSAPEGAADDSDDADDADDSTDDAPF